jgi:hypothetical protein
MFRITKTSGIETIKWFTKEEVDSNYRGNELDSFVIIPGVTNYNHIYSKDKWIVFDSKDSYIGIEFNSPSDLERYFIQLLRDIKLNQITNVSIDTKN